MSNHFTTFEIKLYAKLKSENVYFDRENYRSSINDYFNKFLSFGFLYLCNLCLKTDNWTYLFW